MVHNVSAGKESGGLKSKIIQCIHQALSPIGKDLFLPIRVNSYQPKAEWMLNVNAGDKNRLQPHHQRHGSELRLGFFAIPMRAFPETGVVLKNDFIRGQCQRRVLAARLHR